jgi:hypothetical protein
MKYVAKEVGTKEGVLGTLDFPILESVEEAVELYGERQTLALIQRAVNIDTERIGRDNLKAGKKSQEEVQALINAYKPGQRGSGKPTMKTYVNLMSAVGEAGEIDIMLESQKIYGSEGLEAAVGYLRKEIDKLGL